MKEVNMAEVPAGLDKAAQEHVASLYEGIAGEEKPESKPEVKNEDNVQNKADEKAPQENDKEAQKAKEQEQERLVPYDALHAERERRKELKKQLEERDSHYNKLQSSVVELMEKIAPKEKAENVPSYETDPLGAIQYQINKLDERLETVNKFKSDQEIAAQALKKEQEFIGKYQTSAKEFTAKNPDFMEAYNFLVESRTKELMSIGFSHEEATKEILNNERNIVEKAFNDNANPAERMFQLAKMRGYSANQKDTSSEKLQQLDKGLKAAQSLGAGGAKSDGNVTVDAMTAAEISMMSDAEFEALFSQTKKGR